MSYSLSTLWHDKQRYLPGVLAVMFSALLIALQCGLLMGLFSITSLPIDRNPRAHIWMGAPNVLSVDLGRPISESYLSRLAAQPEVERCEIYLQGFAYWSKPAGGTELCMIIASYLGPDSLGAVQDLTPQMRQMLTEPGAVILDESDMDRLGIKAVGDVAEISGQRVRVVALTRGLRSLAGPYVFCSITTARSRLRMFPEQTTYVLARCKNQADAPRVVERLRRDFPPIEGSQELSVFTSEEFSKRSQLHWLFKTKAGIALGYAAVLGLLVGAVVTSQTLYAATLASLREFAVLRALGIPRWRMKAMVLSQSFWIGVIGVALAYPAVTFLAQVASNLGAEVLRPPWLLFSAAGVTLTMAVLSGLYALRSLRQVEPAILLR